MQARGTALSIDLSMPLDWTKIQNLMTQESTHFDVSLFNSGFPHTLDVSY